MGRPSIVRDTMMTPLLPFLILGLAGVRAETTGACSEHIQNHCEVSHSSWTGTPCNSKFGGFEGNSHSLHKIILDDFSDSMTYLLMSSSFSTDVKNRMGFSKYFKDYSYKMWSRGMDMMKTRTSQLSDAHKRSTSYSSLPTSYDPDTAHMLEEVSESYTEDINEAARKLNTLARIVQQ